MGDVRLCLGAVHSNSFPQSLPVDNNPTLARPIPRLGIAEATRVIRLEEKARFEV
jgi:hypothetical protein